MLEQAKKGETIALVSYGSGSPVVTLSSSRCSKTARALPTDERELTYLTYAEYLEHSGARSANPWNAIFSSPAKVSPDSGNGGAKVSGIMDEATEVVAQSSGMSALDIDL